MPRGRSGSSPHTRGAPSHPLEGLDEAGIIPAYAGSTRFRRAVARPFWDHPRIRGEHCAGEMLLAVFQGSSPHTRGARGGRCRGLRPRLDHPRIRGEHLARNAELLFGEGSSPHTRGAPGNYLQYGNEPRIIPAYAGSTRKTTTSGSTTTDHPRIRGEHSCTLALMPAIAGSSPHTRGARRRCRHSPHSAGIIPAYAGSTKNIIIACVCWSDHPRIRGEHLRSCSTVAVSLGSSPHTRGAREGGASADEGAGDHPRIRGEHVGAGGAAAGVPGIIPAYAGSTGARA